MTSERCTDRGCRDSHAKPLEFALDALITPARILAGQADDQLLDVGIQLRPARCKMRIGPGTCDQPPVPAQQRLGLDEEAGPAGPGQRTAEGGEQRPVGGLQRRSWDLAAEHAELVTQDEKFQVLGGVAADGNMSSWMERHSVR
jgi:hypothetical protein